MSPYPRPPDRFSPALRRAAARVRRRHVVALSAVAAAAFGLLGLRAIDLPGPRPIGESDRLRIEVVHPVEPEIIPGSVMDVGALVDGFQGLPPPLPPLEDVAWSHDPDWEEDIAPLPPPRRSAAAYIFHRPPEPREPPPRLESRWFGFDAPRRDYHAERAARRARMDAMDRRARERREARRREWIERREEWLDRREYERDRERWREEDERGRDDWSRDDAGRDEAAAARGAFTGPQ